VSEHKREVERREKEIREKEGDERRKKTINIWK
jgi:hypothetical protein